MKNRPVQEIMTTNLITVNKHESLSKIAEVFKEQIFHHIPIVDNDGSLKGIISRMDFEGIKSGGSLFRNPQKEDYNKSLFRSMLAEDIMTKDVKALQPTDTLQKAYNIFKDNKFRALPIIGRGKLVGIITPLDILDFFFKD